MSPVSATMSNEILSFRQSRNKLNMFSLFPHCRKDEISFDIVAETGNIVAENGNIVAENGNIVAKNCNNVEATFYTIEKIVQLVAFDNVASTLLLVWTGLYRRRQKTNDDDIRRQTPATFTSLAPYSTCICIGGSVIITFMWEEVEANLQQSWCWTNFAQTSKMGTVTKEFDVRQPGAPECLKSKLKMVG